MKLIKNFFLYVLVIFVLSEMSLNCTENRLSQLPNFQKLVNQTLDLSVEAAPLMRYIRSVSGVIYIISFSEGRDFFPTIISHLSATILNDGNILTSFHALDPLIRTLQQNNQRFLLFFMPGTHAFNKISEVDGWAFGREHEINTDTKSTFWNNIPSKYTLPKKIMELESSMKIESKPMKTSEFLSYIHNNLKEANPSFSNKSELHINSIRMDSESVQLPHDDEIKIFEKFNQTNPQHRLYLIKTITNPSYGKREKIQNIYILSNNLTKIDRENDIGICEVINHSSLPKSHLKLLTFDDGNIKGIIQKSNMRNIFISSCYNNHYFFIGGSKSKKTSDISFNYDVKKKDKIINLKVPLPQIRGCSGGALIVASKNEDNKYNLSETKILGVVSSGSTAQNQDSIDCCVWKE